MDMPPTPPMPPVPPTPPDPLTNFWKNLPYFMHGLGMALVPFGAWIQSDVLTDPKFIETFGPMANVPGIITMLSGLLINISALFVTSSNNKVTTKALEETHQQAKNLAVVADVAITQAAKAPALIPPGVDPTRYRLRLALTEASKHDNFEMVDAINALLRKPATVTRVLPLLFCFLLSSSVEADIFARAKPKTEVKTKISNEIASVSGSPASKLRVDPIPTISLPESISANPGAWIVLRAVTTCPHILWVNDDTSGDLNVLDSELLADPYVTIASSVVPGEQYRIKAIAASADVPIQSNWCVITINGPRPPPGPSPDPTPTPTPPTPGPTPPPAPPTPVITGPLQIITLDNAAARTPAIASVVGNINYWQAIRKAGNSIYLMDSNSPQAGQYAAWVQKAGGLPIVMFGSLDANKKLVIAGVEKLPPDTNGMNTLILKYGGKVQ